MSSDQDGFTDKWVIVAQFQTAVEAHVLKTKFESEGIEARLVDDNLVSINPLATTAIGGVKVQVKLSDLDRAGKIVEGREE